MQGNDKLLIHASDTKTSVQEKTIDSPGLFCVGDRAEAYLRVIRTTFSTWWVWGNMSTGCTSSTR